MIFMAICMILTSLPVYASDQNHKNQDNLEVPSIGNVEIEGKSYKVFIIEDLKPSDLIKQKPRGISFFKAGDIIPDWKLKVDWIGKTDEFPYPEDGFEFKLLNTNTKKVYGVAKYPKKFFNEIGRGTKEVSFTEIDNVDIKKLGHSVYVLAPDSVDYEPKLFLEGAPQNKGVITMAYISKVNPIFKSQWNIKESTIPNINAYIIDNNDITKKMEFYVPKNQDEYYSIFAEQPEFFNNNGKKQKVTTHEEAYKGDNEEYIGIFPFDSLSLGLTADPSIEFGYGKTRRKITDDNITIGGTKYLINIFGDHKSIKIFTIYSPLNVTFNSNLGKLSDQENQTVKVNGKDTQEIGMNEYFDNTTRPLDKNRDSQLVGKKFPKLDTETDAEYEFRIQNVYVQNKILDANNEIVIGASGRKVLAPTETLTAPEVNSGITQKFIGWSEFKQEKKTVDEKEVLTQPTQEKPLLLDNNGNLTEEGKKYKFKDDTTLYAVFAPEPQGYANVRYVFRTEAGGQKQVIDSKYRAVNDDTKYPSEISGDKDTRIDMSKYTIGIQGQKDFDAPKFIGFKYKGPEIEGSKVNYTDPKTATLDLVYTKEDEVIKKEKGTTVPEGYVDVTFKASENSKISDGIADIVYSVNPKAEVKIVDDNGFKFEGKKSNGEPVNITVPEVTAADGYKLVNKNTSQDQKASAWNYDKIDKVYTNITEEITFNSQVEEKGNGTAKLVYVDESGTILKPTENTNIQIAGETYEPNLSGKDNTDIEFNRENAPKLLGYELVEGNDAITKTAEKFVEGQEATITLKYKVLPDIIPSKERKDKPDDKKVPDGYVTIEFKADENGKTRGEFAASEETKYYVNPKANKTFGDITKPTVTLKATDGTKPLTGDDAWKANSGAKYTSTTPITKDETFTAQYQDPGKGTATLAYQDEKGANITPTDDALAIDGETYKPSLSGKHGTALPTYTKLNAPKIRGYKFVEQISAAGNYNQDTPATITLKYEKLDDIIPGGPGVEKPDGYVTVTFKDVDGAKLNDADASVLYYVNPKATTKAKVVQGGNGYNITGTKKDGSEFSQAVPTVKNDANYEIQYAEGSDNKWAYNKFNLVNNDITTDTTFTAQVKREGEPTVSYPPTDIDKGEEKLITPEMKDKDGGKVNTPDEKPTVTKEPGNGITVTPNDNGTIKVNVPKDYNGPGTVEIKVTVKIGGKDVPTNITVNVKSKDIPLTPLTPAKKIEDPDWDKYLINNEPKVPTYPVYAVVPKKEEIHNAYIKGYEDENGSKTVQAENNMTRAEAAAMVTRLKGLDLSDNSKPEFSDVKDNAWYNVYINAAVKAGMLDADDNMIRPNDKITRAEFAKMIAAIDTDNNATSNFEDIKGHRYEKEINKIYGNKRIEGYEDGSFRPDGHLTRAEATAFLNRMFNRVADAEAIKGLEDKLVKFTDLDSSKWYYYDVVEASNTHKLERRSGRDKFDRVYEDWKEVLETKVN